MTVVSIESSLPTTVSVGSLAKSALLEQLLAQGILLNRAAELLFADDRFQPAHERRDFEIAPFSVADLGYPGGATYPDLTARALERGVVQCPLELAAYLRLQFRQQLEVVAAPLSGLHRAPAGAITVASAPLDDSDETPKGFYVRCCNGELWLRGYWSSPAHLWHTEDVLVFCRG